MAEKAETGFKCELKVEDVRLWSTWIMVIPGCIRQNLR